jgi:hypothetical protein
MVRIFNEPCDEEVNSAEEVLKVTNNGKEDAIIGINTVCGFAIARINDDPTLIVLSEED